MLIITEIKKSSSYSRYMTKESSILLSSRLRKVNVSLLETSSKGKSWV